MINQQNLEIFYDCLEESIHKLYEFIKEDYYKLIIHTCNNILSNKINQNITQDQEEDLQVIYNRLDNIDFNREEIRKALQAIILKWLKEKKYLNGETTPDTLGLFIGYLIEKFKKSNHIQVLDPVLGTGNMLQAIANNFDFDMDMFGIDNHHQMVELAQITSNMQDLNINIYFQDTLDITLSNMDFIVGDIPNYETQHNTCFDMDLILHHMKSLKDNGYMILIILNDLFSRDKDNNFKTLLTKQMSIVGLIELPTMMFKENPKSILIIQKNTKKQACLLVKLPGFDDLENFNKTLLTIENWFKNRK